MSTRTRQVTDYRENGMTYWNTYEYSWAGGGQISYGPKTLISVTTQNDRTFVARERIRTMTDEVIENYYARSRAGEIFINPMVSEISEQEALPGMGFIYFKEWPGFPAYFKYETPAADYIKEPEAYKSKIAQAIKQASTQAMSRVTSEEMLVLATIGELKESKEMLVTAAKRLLNLRKPLKKLLFLFRKRKEFSKRRRIAWLKAFESTWLEVRMGWRPFFGEIQNIIETINSSKEFPKRKTFRGKSLPIDYTFCDTRARGTNSPHSWYFTEERKFSAEAQVRSGVLARMRTDGWPDTYGLTKIPQTIWELTTLSWAVDYFFNVGEVIAAYVPDTLWEVLGAWTTVEETIVQTVSNEKIQPPDYLVSAFKSGIRVRTVKRKKRIPGSSIAITFRPRMDVAKYIDIMAVSRQKITPLIKSLMKFSRKRK